MGAGVFSAPPTEAGRGFDCLPRALRDGGPVGCRLQAFLPAWAAITDDKFVLSVIRNGFVIGLTESLPGGALRAPTKAGRRLFQAGIALEIASLLKKRAIERVSDQPRLCLSPVFLVPKRSGNQFIQPVHFRMETLAAILPMLKRVDWAVSIDLSDAYHHVPIARPSRRLLGFSFAGRVYQYRALPFGLRPAPRLFTRLISAVAALLRGCGIRVFCYLDDWLIVADTPTPPHSTPGFTLGLVQSLGFLINWEKSALTPTQHPVFLGAEIDMPNQLARPTRERVGKILVAARALRARETAPARTWMQFLGYLASLVEVLPDCRLYMRPLQIHFLRFFGPTWTCFHAWSRLPISFAPSWSGGCGALFSRRAGSSPYPTRDYGDDRCVTAGMGGGMRRTDGERGLVAPLTSPAYKSARVQGRDVSVQTLPVTTRGQGGVDSDGQYHCRVVHQQAGRNALDSAQSACDPILELVSRTSHYPHGILPPRGGEPGGGFPIAGQGVAVRVDVAPPGHEPNSKGIRPPSGRPLCVESELPDTAILLPIEGSGSVESGRIFLSLGKHSGVCVPPDSPHSSCPPQDTGGQDDGSVDSPLVAQEALVSGIGESTGSTAQFPTGSSGCNQAAVIPHAAQEPDTVAPNCVAIVGQESRDAGLSERAAEFIAHSLRESTRESYDSRLAG